MIEQLAAGPARRLVVIGAGLAGVLLGLFLLAILLGGNDDEVRIEGPRRAAPAAAPVPSAPPESQVQVGVETIETAPAVLAGGRDPFQQVVTVPEDASPAGQPGPASPASPSALPSLSPQPAAPSDVAGSAPDVPVDSSQAALELTSIARDGTGPARAHIIVDGNPYAPAEGEIFAFGFRLELVDGNCVEVSAGPERLRMCLPATGAVQNT